MGANNTTLNRNTKKAKQDAICEALREGSTRSCAYNLVGVHCDTFYTWLKDDPRFTDNVLKAESDAQRTFEEALMKGVRGWISTEETETKGPLGTTYTTKTKENFSPESAKFWLERRRRADYGPELNLRQVTTETLKELLPDHSQSTIPKLNDSNTIDAAFTPDE